MGLRKGNRIGQPNGFSLPLRFSLALLAPMEDA